MKRILACLLAMVLLSSCLCSTAWAQASRKQELPTVTKQLSFSPAPTYDLEEAVDEQALRAYLFEQMKNCETEINVSSFEISASLWSALTSFIFYEMPECFHQGGSISGSTMGGKVYSVSLTYTMDAESFAQAKADCDEVAAQLLKGIPADTSMGEKEKALLVHDRLAVWCEYDTSLKLPDVHNMVGALANGVAVCQGYAMAYSYLLRQVGMKCRYCSSEEMVHGWNIVTVDGVDYHVDVTWDDPTGDITGRVLHDNFLLSSAGIKATGHHKDGVVDYDTRPNDTRYEGYFWGDSQAEFQLLNGEIYYLDSEQGMLKRYSDGQELLEVTDIWYASATGYWPGNYARLSNNGKVLLYSLSDGIYSYDPKTEQTALVLEPDLSYGDYFKVYGFTWRDGEAIVDVNASPNFTPAVKQAYQQKLPYAGAFAGDVNGDGEINGADSILLLQYLAEWDVGINHVGADCNGDSEINGADSILLLQYLAEWDVSLG